MTHTKIPHDELRVFESLTDVKVVFDVGSRDDVDYLIIKPGIELHAFEPNPAWFEELKTNVGSTKNVYLNNFALGDKEGIFLYNHGGQSIGARVENPEVPNSDETRVQVKRLDTYMKEHNIQQIDFLKMDVEGYEAQVIEGMGDMITFCRYIQYEQAKSGSKSDFCKFLSEKDFDLYYVGYRNVLGVRKGEITPYIPDEPLEGGQGEKDKSNYLVL